MMGAGLSQFSQLTAVDESEITLLAEITMNSTISGDTVYGADFLARVDLPASPGLHGDDLGLRAFLPPARLLATLYAQADRHRAVGATCSLLFDEKYYEGMEGDPEGLGKLFPDNTYASRSTLGARATDASATVTSSTTWPSSTTCCPTRNTSRSAGAAISPTFRRCAASFSAATTTNSMSPSR